MTARHEIELVGVDGHGLELARDLWRCKDCGVEVWIEAPARERPDTHAWLQAVHLVERRVWAQLTKMVGRYWPGSQFQVVAWHGDGSAWVEVDADLYVGRTSRLRVAALVPSSFKLVDHAMPGEHLLSFEHRPDRSFEPMGDDMEITCSTCGARAFISAPYEFDLAWVTFWQDAHWASLDRGRFRARGKVVEVRRADGTWDHYTTHAEDHLADSYAAELNSLPGNAFTEET